MGLNWSNSMDEPAKPPVLILDDVVKNESKDEILIKNLEDRLEKCFEKIHKLKHENLLMKHNKLSPEKTHELVQSVSKNKTQDRDYEYLVLSGGGIKGLAFGSSLTTLDSLGLLYDSDKSLKLKGICGTSAGSIIVSMLAIGYMPDEILSNIKKLDTKMI